MAGDWVKLYRDAIYHEVFQDESLWQMFSWCLLKANYRDGLFKGRRVKSGQFATGKIRGAEALGIAPSTWLYRMRRLESLGCIEIKADHDLTIVTVCNWPTYQSDAPEELTASQTTTQTTNGPQTDTIEERKEEEEVKPRGRQRNPPKSPAPEPVIPPSLKSSADFAAAWDDWIAHRVEKKNPATPTAIKNLLLKLERIGPDRAVAAIRHSVANGWTGIFEERSNGTTQPAGRSAEQSRLQGSLSVLAEFGKGDSGGLFPSDGTSLRLEADQ